MLLWDSTHIPGNHFSFSKFCPPVVADGKVFVPTYDGRVDIYRWPRRHRPCVGAMLVFAHVSSMNTRRLGSSCWSSCQRVRSAAMSGRSCSAAHTIFFKGDLLLGEESPNRAIADAELCARQASFLEGAPAALRNLKIADSIGEALPKRAPSASRGGSRTGRSG
jgi:hypothetical protein